MKEEAEASTKKATPVVVEKVQAQTATKKEGGHTESESESEEESQESQSPKK